MADVFISYTNEDLARVSMIARALEASGLSVWWDQDIRGGAHYSAVIEEEIQKAGSVLVVWSETSIKSQWVADEAEIGRGDGKLLPVILDEVSPPIGFRQIQTINLSDWHGDAGADVFSGLLQAITQEKPVAVEAIPPATEQTPAQSALTPRTMLLAAVTVLVIAVGVFIFQPNGKSGQSAEQPVQSADTLSLSERNFDGRGAIAVMPFINLSGGTEQDYFSDGITEDLIFALHSYRVFPIIGRTSTFTYKNTSKSIPTIATELGASYLITGSVRRSDRQVRISAELLDASGQTLWANRYDIPWSDTYTVQDEIVASIFSEIAPELLKKETDLSEHVRPENMTAWDYYLQARSTTMATIGTMDINGRPITVEGNERARKLVEKAIELEPDFAAGYALLMHIDGAYSTQLGMYVSEEFRAEAMERSLKNGYIAMRLNPFEANACSCLALNLQIQGRIDEALQIQEEALRLLPTNHVIHAALAKILESDGQFERALREIRTAIRLSPRDIEMSTYLYFEAAIHLGLGDFKQAVETADRALSHSPGHLDAHAIRILSLYAEGQRKEAAVALGALETEIPDFSPRGVWEGPIHPALANTLSRTMREKLEGEKLREGFHQIIVDLGWQEGDA